MEESVIHVYKFLLRWIQQSWMEDKCQILITQLLSGVLNFGQGGRQWCHIWILRSKKILSWYLFSCSSLKFNFILQHSIHIQPTVYDLDDCIVSLILVDQILAIVYHTLDEFVFCSCCGPVKTWLTSGRLRYSRGTFSLAPVANSIVYSNIPFVFSPLSMILMTALCPWFL